MIAKVPFLVSNIDGPIEIINNGSFFEFGDFKDCSIKINEIILNNNEFGNKKRFSNIHKNAIKKFDIFKTAKNYIKNYLA